ncbi:MAG: CHASE3 domain-containing protein [Terriglobales bacterium]
MRHSPSAQKSVRWRLLITAALPFLLVLLSAGLLKWSLDGVLRRVATVDQSNVVLANVHETEKTVTDMQSSLRAYLLTDNPEYLRLYEQGLAKTDREFREMDRIASVKPEIKASLGKGGVAMAEFKDHARRMIALKQNKGDYLTPEAKGESKAVVDRIRAEFGEVIRMEDGLLRQHTSEAQAQGQFSQLFNLALTFGLGLLLAAFAFVQMTSVAREYDLTLADLEVERLRQAVVSRLVQEKSYELETLNRELDNRVRDRTAELEASVRELDSFSYSVSHDLRAPLRSLDGFSHALVEDYGGKFDAEGNKYLERIRANSQHMGLLIDALLVLARVSRNDLQKRNLDLSGMATEVMAEIQSAEPRRTSEVAIEPGVTGYGDVHLVRIAMENLLRNAWKYSSKRPDARLAFGQTGQNGHTEYFVRDNGVGFDMVYADKLFTAFQRLHGEGEFPGTGIGLTTAYRIVRRHGGKMRAEAAVGKGATFYFSLQEEKKDANELRESVV